MGKIYIKKYKDTNATYAQRYHFKWKATPAK